MDDQPIGPLCHAYVRKDSTILFTVFESERFHPRIAIELRHSTSSVPVLFLRISANEAKLA